MIEIKDVYAGEVAMEVTSNEKYLGDIISQDGRKTLNIKWRIGKGREII